MEKLLSRPFYSSWRRYWRRKRYQRLNATTNPRKNVKIIRYGSSPRRVWRIKTVAKIGYLRLASSPLKLLRKIKNGYVNMMVSLAGNVGSLNNTNFFGSRRVPKGRQIPVSYSNKDEFEERLIFEIYKALIATRELAPKPRVHVE